MLRLTIVLFTLLLLPCCRQPPQEKSGSSLDDLFEEFHRGKTLFNPLEATKAGDYRYNDRLPNFISDEYQQEQEVFYREFKSTAAQIDQSDLSSVQRISLDALLWECNIKLKGLQNELVTIASPLFDLPAFELFPIFQISALHLYMGQLAGGQSVQPFDTPKHYDDWIARNEDFMSFLDASINKMQEGLERDLVLPVVLIERVIGQLKPFTTLPAEEHIYYGPVKIMPDDFTEAERNRLQQAYTSLISDVVVPKYRELERFLVEEYLPRGRKTSGIGDLPGGKEAYNYLIRYHTTTDMTAREIHDLGLREVARIKSEMEAIKQEIGFEGDLRSFFDHIRTDPRQMPFTDPEEVLAHFNEIHLRMKENVDRLFDLQPKAGFVVRRTEAFREAAAAAEYVPGTKDGLRPGTFYVPVPDVRRYNKFTDEALFLHEAVPGHHYQLSLQQENQDLPAFLHAEGMGVFVEGWALYAESLGEELGLYTDPYQRFGMLSMEMHRAIRLVVDTGIHALGWSREEAVEYSLQNEAESEEDITAEIERYMAVPAQALSYKIGQLKITELRNRANQALGDAFDIRQFHNQVLNSGSLPMTLLEQKIDRWISDIQSNSEKQVSEKRS